MVQIIDQTNTPIKQCYVQDVPRMSLNNIYNTKGLTIMVTLAITSYGHRIYTRSRKQR